LFLAYASFMGFIYGTIDEEAYVMQPLGFQDPEFPDRVYKVEKAMYGLHQAPRACGFGGVGGRWPEVGRTLVVMLLWCRRRGDGSHGGAAVVVTGRWCRGWQRSDVEMRRRVGESGLKDRVDRKTGSLFGFAEKSPPEKFSGGGSVVAGGWERE
nr:putative ribonuclease H-like domain-containing protein [Tanacetum cinerariifolium]